MSDAPPPPPPSHPPPPPGAGGYPGHPGYSGQPGAYVIDVDPEAAGMVRTERPGWALLFAVPGIFAVVASLFLEWVVVELWVVYDSGRPAGDLEDTREEAGIFGAIDSVKDVAGPAPESHDPSVISTIFFPWGILLLTIVACLLVGAAAWGLRNKLRTNAARIGSAALLVLLTIWGFATYFDLGFETDGSGFSSTPRATTPGNEPVLSYISSNVEPFYGPALWGIGAILLFIAGCLGPRIVHKLPPGGLPGGPVAMPAAGQPFADPFGVARQTLAHRTQMVAVVLTSLAGALCLLGYAVLPWASGNGDSASFYDIGDAVREYGGGDDALIEAYFAALGWIFLLVVLGAVALVALGRRGTGVNAKLMRPILVGAMVVMVLVHLYALYESGADLFDYDVGAHAVTLGLLLGFLGTILPLRRSTRVLVGGQHH